MRVRYPWGSTARISASLDDTLDTFLLKALNDRTKQDGIFNITDDGIEWYWSIDASGKHLITKKSLPFSLLASDLDLHQGDTLYLHTTKDIAPNQSKTTRPVVDQLDIKLLSQSGMINRERDSHFCRHSENAMCDYCSPLNSYDSSYLREKGIKHLSFHSYIKQQLKDSPTKITIHDLLSSSDSIPLLEELSYRIPSCSSHAPYPLGLCSKCQPNAITLQPQAFRMIDHVEIDHGGLIDSFLKSWRDSGYQCFGILYGSWEIFDGVPLGIRAVVSVIHEPFQDGSVDGFELLNDPENELYHIYENLAEKTASWLGLQQIGMIYTDLIDDGTGKGTVLSTRGPLHDYFVTCYEALWMARQQLKHRYICPWSKSNRFGSRFVTVIVSGEDHSGSISLSSYQVSLSAMAMIEADLITSSSDPSSMYVLPSTNQRYVPEIFYRKGNEKNGENASSILCKADPTFPVDFLLVTLSHGFPSQPRVILTSGSFPMKRYLVQIKGQTVPRVLLQALDKYFNPMFNLHDSITLDHLKLFSDFGVLMAITWLDILSEQDYNLLKKAIMFKEIPSFEAFLESGSWETIRSLLRFESEHIIDRDVDMIRNSENDSAIISRASIEIIPWTCQHCTFVNTNEQLNHQVEERICEMCGLPNSI